MASRVTKILSLSLSLLSVTGCTDQNRLMVHCTGGHWGVKAVPAGPQDVLRQTWVCDATEPVVRWNGHTYRLGAECLDCADLQEIRR